MSTGKEDQDKKTEKQAKTPKEQACTWLPSS
jgi:hypothetical protein